MKPRVNGRISEGAKVRTRIMRLSIKENPLELSLRSSSLNLKKSSRYANEK
jgi:hypothetical protein